MTILMVIFMKFPDSTWPLDGCFVRKCFSQITTMYCLKSIQSSSKWEVLRYNESYEDICQVRRFKMAAWRQFFPEIFMFSHITPKVLLIEYPFKFQLGGFEVWKFYEDICKVPRFKMAIWRLYFSKMFMFFTYDEKYSEVVHLILCPIPDYLKSLCK